MRTIKELLELLREKLPTYLRTYNSGGMCSVAYNLVWRDQISRGELDLLLDYINSNKPEELIPALICPEAPFFDVNKHWWTPCSIEPRIAWLNEQIEKLN